MSLRDSPSASSIMFESLMSRWAIPCACRHETADTSCALDGGSICVCVYVCVGGWVGVGVDVDIGMGVGG